VILHENRQEVGNLVADRHVKGEEQLEVILLGGIENVFDGVYSPRVLSVLDVNSESINPDGFCILNIPDRLISTHRPKLDGEVSEKGAQI